METTTEKVRDAARVLKLAVDQAGRKTGGAFSLEIASWMPGVRLYDGEQKEGHFKNILMGELAGDFSEHYATEPEFEIKGEVYKLVKVGSAKAE